MQDIQPELIEKYQILLQKDPKSQVFAPLAEAYRKMGLVEEAFRIAVRGVQFNPNFPGGRIALAKVFIDRDNLPSAIEELEKAVNQSADNILAHSLLGECYLKTQRSKEALRSFKLVLFLAPNNERAQTAVRKLESLTADEYEDDLFEMKPLATPEAKTDLATEASSAQPIKPLVEGHVSHDLDRILSLCDAYIVRNDTDKAAEVLKQGELSFGSHPELVKRLRLVNQRTLGLGPVEDQADSMPPPNRVRHALEVKISLLQDLLKRVQLYSQFTG
jgi:tetratricopeptide (TPR) repeat protein